jgi:hypothetical protein
VILDYMRYADSEFGRTVLVVVGWTGKNVGHTSRDYRCGSFPSLNKMLLVQLILLMNRNPHVFVRVWCKSRCLSTD